MDNELILKLNIYEGPLDLLLHLIKKNEVDINDIPISLITAQYLDYLGLMESFNLDVASDFLIMAATLTHIKSRMLLPQNSEDQDGDAVIDPRQELVVPLLEYAAYQMAAESLGSRLLLDRDVFLSGSAGQSRIEYIEEPGPAEAPLAKSTIFELVDAWSRLAGKRASDGLTLSYLVETKTLGEKLEEIRQFLRDCKTAHFKDLINDTANCFELALSFLAILELARTGFLKLYQDTDTDLTGPRLFLADPSAVVF
ncbi:MAG: segregation/condensation protein A, partial [Deltaproteobacteria bacterium]|nr:segregation/condensation protein A [Deltaproteobacteria bacterium]